MKMRLLWLVPLLFLMFLLIGLGLLVSTAPGTRWLLSSAIRFAPGRLHIAETEGTLLGPLTLKGVEYTDESGALAVEEIGVTWRPTRLLRGELWIETLSVRGIRYRPSSEERPPSQETGGALPSVDLPLRVVVSKATIDKITYAAERSVTLDRIAFTGRIDEGGLQIQSLQVAAPQFEVFLSGKVDPHGAYPFEVSATWSAFFLPDTPFRGKGEVHGTLKQFNLRHQVTEPFSIATEGTVLLKETTPAFDLNGSWSDVRWPPAEAMIESARGTYRLTGRIDDYRFHLQTDLQGPPFPGSLWKIEGTGTQTAATFTEVDVRTLTGKINGHGKIGWEPELQWVLALGGSGLNPAEQWPDWQGEVTFQLDTRGKWTGRGPIGEFRLSNLKGKLRGYPVAFRAHLKMNQEAYALETLDLQSGAARLTAAGTLKDEWDLRWKIQAPDLAALLPDAAGRLIGSGRIRGARALPTISAALQGEALKWTETKVNRFQMNGLVDLQDRIESHLDFKAEGIEAAGQVVTQAHINGKGRLTGHVVQADVHSRDQQASLQLEGGVEKNRWKGALRRSFIQDTRLGRWTLDQPIPMILAADIIRVEHGCWLQEPARLCVAGQWQRQQGWQTEGRAERLPLALMKPWLPPEVILSGALDGEWTARQEGELLQFKTEWIPRPGMLVYKIAEGEKIDVPYRDGRFQAELEGETLQVKTQLTLTGYGALQAALSLAPMGSAVDWRQSRLKGTVQAHLDQLEPITAFVPSVTQVGGKLRIHFSLAGTPNEPRVTGNALFDEGKVRLAALGINLADARLEIRSGENGTLLVHGEARSDPGSVNVDGTIALNAEQGWPTHLSIRGERFEAVDLPEARLLASPDLTLQIQGRRIDLNGAVLIPEAQITPRELPKGAVQVSEDTVVIRSPSGNQNQSNAARRQIHTHVTIRFGDKAAFNGFGLSGRVAGELLVTETPDQPTLAEGTLRIVEGQYRAYGQKLDIEEGQLIFAGPTDNPGLDIRAVRKVEQITAGIHVSGTLKRPQSTLFSEPPMDDANTLSYLLLGRPLHQASSAEGDLLTKAISALGIKGGNLLAKRIGRTLGLDEVSLQAGDSIEQTTLVIGKYLSPRFYVSYGIGLFEASNTLSLRYKLNQSLTLRAQSGVENTLDLLYTHEYD